MAASGALSRLRPVGLLPLLTLLLLVSFLLPPHRAAAGVPEQGEGLVPGAFLSWPEGGSEYAILVDKSDQKVLVFHQDDPGRPHRVFNCSTGENHGPKRRVNDRKTPEGIYFFTNTFLEDELAPIYGVRAFPIDYPSPMDGKDGKDGYGIWFHGTNRPLKPNDTNGCVVLENQDIDELAAYITLHETPAVIAAKPEWVAPETLERERETLEGLVEKWRAAWENKEIDDYISIYSPRFSSGGKDRREWKAYKRRLARQYKSIAVEIDHLHLLKQGGLALAKFNQDYRASGFGSHGEKRLYFRQNSEQWRIVGEFFSETQKRPSPPKRPSISSLKEIGNFVYFWKKAWEEKDLAAYIACYHPEFRSRGMDIAAWKRHRKRLNNKYGSLEVGISHLKIKQVSRHKAKVSFVQDYRADEYRDLGLKKMVLIKKDEKWQIKEEEWQATTGGRRR